MKALFLPLLLLSMLVAICHSQITGGGLRCRILSIDLDYDHSEGEEKDQMFRCLTEGDQEPDGLQDMTYMLKLPREFVETHSCLENGNTYVIIESGYAIRENEDGTASIYYPNATEIVEIPPTRRHLGVAERRQGVKSLLVLRVTASDSDLSLSREELSARTFGIGDNAPVVNVRSQYNSCSFGKFKIIPATGEGISGGVADVQIDNVVGKDPFALENQVVAVAEKTLGHLESRFDHVMICLPPGTLYQGTRSKWYAYGYRNWYRTVYNNKWCGYYSVPMHEIGHNLNLQHSSEGSTLYGDQTGLMGYSYPTVGAPSMCFNGHKNWLLGWVSDKSVTVDTTKAWSGRLYASVDYLHRLPQNSYVLIRVGDLYLQYNRARRFNSGTQERKNQVTIVRGPGDDATSLLLGGVAVGIPDVEARQRILNFANTGFALVIEACEQVYGPPDYVRISIYLDNGEQKSTCVADPPTRPPTKAPTGRPTLRPTLRPTPSPTLSPTSSPTSSPASLPTSLRKATAPPPSSICADLTTKTFYVNGNWRDQDCEWLNVRPNWQIYLCHPSHDAYHICGEMCGKCDGSNVLPPPEMKADCDDSMSERFFVNEERGYKDCPWLSKNPIYHGLLCVPGRDAYDLCEDTCRKCTDRCDDNLGTFFVNDKQGTQDCLWLSERPGWQASLCHEGHVANEMCQETCNTCSI